MTNKILTRNVALATIASLLISVAFVPAADAKDKNRSGSFTTGNGRTGTYDRSVEGKRSSDDGRTTNSTVTGKNGKTFTRESNTVYDKDTNIFSKTVTRPNGNTRTFTGTAENGERTGTYTTSNGKTGTFDGTVSKEDGTLTREGTWTNENGVTKNRSVTYDYDKETHTGTRTVTNNNGKTKTGTVTVVPSGNE